MNVNVLGLSSEKIKFLLSNHKYFSRDEIVLAAKMKVINDKKDEYGHLSLGQQQNAMYNRRLDGIGGLGMAKGGAGGYGDLQSVLGFRF